MKYPIIIFLLMIAVAVAVIVSCKKEQPKLPDPVNPCEECLPVEASFYMGKYMSFNNCDNTSATDYDTIYIGDTVVGGIVRFRSTVDCYDKLEWIVGYDTTKFIGETISLNFPSSTYGTSIPISLIASKAPNLSCYPNDDGIDTLTKILVVTNDINNKSWFGSFQGCNIDESPTDTFTVAIIHQDDNNNGLPVIQNLNLGCDIPFGFAPFDMYLNYRRIDFCKEFDFGGFGCHHTKGIIYYSVDYDTITVDYSYSIDPSMRNEPGNQIIKTFKGVKI
jgi:hypothetical protein